MATQVVNLKTGYGTVGPNEKYRNVKEWIDASPDHVYIGRRTEVAYKGAFNGAYILHRSKFHNPYTVKQHQGDDPALLFEEHLERHPTLGKDAVTELKGKVLGCWCKGIRNCHGDVLVEFIQKQIVV